MLKYGVDKPDLRNPLLIADVTAEFAEDAVEFKAFKGVIKSGGVVRAIPATGAATQPRSFFDKLNDFARAEGAPGLGYVVFEEVDGALTGKGPIAKFIPAPILARIAEKTGTKAGDAVFFSAGTEAKAAALAGKARIRIGDDLGLSDKDQFAFCWITDVRVERGREAHRLLAQPVLDAELRPRRLPGARRRRRRQDPRHQGVPVRHRLQRHRAVVGRDPEPQARDHGEGVRDRGLRARRA
jgi:aspartyl-tRNA synthetase